MPGPGELSMLTPQEAMNLNVQYIIPEAQRLQQNYNVNRQTMSTLDRTLANTLVDPVNAKYKAQAVTELEAARDAILNNKYGYTRATDALTDLGTSLDKNLYLKSAQQDYEIRQRAKSAYDDMFNKGQLDEYSYKLALRKLDEYKGINDLEIAQNNTYTPYKPRIS